MDDADALRAAAPGLAVVLAVVLAGTLGVVAAVLSALGNEAGAEDRLGLKRDWIGGESESLSDGEKMVGKDGRLLRFMTFTSNKENPARANSARRRQDGVRPVQSGVLVKP